jgi:hypothetical protein
MRSFLLSLVAAGLLATVVDRPLFAMQLAVTYQRGAIVHRRVEQGHNKFEGSPDLSLYLPLKVRYTAIVVAKGATLTPPSGW